MDGINLRIIELIETLKVSPNAFAKALEVSSATIYNIIKGKNKPGYDLLLSIVFKYDVKWKWLMVGEDEIFIKREQEQQSKSQLSINPMGEIERKSLLSSSHAFEEYTKKLRFYQDAIATKPNLKKIDQELYQLGDLIQELELIYREFYTIPMQEFLRSINLNESKDPKRFIENNKAYFDKLNSLNDSFKNISNSINEVLSYFPEFLNKPF